MDDQLLECVSYVDLDAQLQIVFKKIVNLIDLWLREAKAMGKPYEILITADHGMTMMQEVRPFEKTIMGAKVGDRHVRLPKDCESAPSGFYTVSAEGAPNSRYLIPKKRVRLVPRPHPFVHGGVTAEELLIPLISLKASVPSDQPLISVEPAAAVAVSHALGWCIALKIDVGNKILKSCSIQAVEPFSGQLTLNALSPNSKQEYVMQFSSLVTQTGTVALRLRTRFLEPENTSYTTQEFSVAIALQQKNLIRGKDEADFDGMFD